MAEPDLRRNIESRFAEIDQWILKLAKNDTLDTIV